MDNHILESGFVVLPNKESVSQAGARHFASLARQCTGSGVLAIALSGGSTPRRLFQLLASPPYQNRLPWDQIHLFWGDERCVPPGHPDSNYRMTRESLLDHIHIPAQNVHRIRGELPPLEAAQLYRAELENMLGKNPRFDLVLLGMGDDGHTASLFPGAASLDERDHTAIAVYAPHLDAWRVTLTLPVLNRARHVLFVVSGANKAPALARIRAGEPLPAGLIRPVRGTLTWLLDRKAAGQEPRSTR